MDTLTVSVEKISVNFSTCGFISHFTTWQMEKSEIFFIMCTIYDILLHSKLFCGKRFFAVFWKIGLLQLTLYCEEKILAKNSGRGEKWQISGMVAKLPHKLSISGCLLPKTKLIIVLGKVSTFKRKISSKYWKTFEMLKNFW